ncbi:hypothetical protein [Corynebacterium efficiens YS-314]|uniref:Uncharacterized protein n=1 Tax=Corynebacterium efficiens (strain DSM 44549 / YS-314 / AJ 12310 / JCM 11189 / NBRC 100395) TaxID=196164 RepID=Q8FSX6_COREF|nr:hypothetical protein [Corynebacterium efficiens YS-314]
MGVASTSSLISATWMADGWPGISISVRTWIILLMAHESTGDINQRGQLFPLRVKPRKFV